MLELKKPNKETLWWECRTGSIVDGYYDPKCRGVADWPSPYCPYCGRPMVRKAVLKNESKG